MMGHEDLHMYRVYKVFVASPGDVLRERETAHRTIDEVNRILASLGMPLRLEVYAWEGRTYPKPGLPQSVILKQIPIEQCDIFIGMFWRRFGTPPGTVRPRDGRPYLSGTEQEIDEAFEACRKSPIGRPVIMLYRKTDPPPAGMTDEDYKQYARVIEFFQQCKPGGEHPALISEFEADQFGGLLLHHLLRVVREFEEEEKISKPVALEPAAYPNSLAHWLNSVGLRDNPFRDYQACEDPALPAYFVQLGRLRLSELINARQSWVLFADRGFGKTTLRMMVAARCYPQTRDSDVLCVECGLDELEAVLKQAGSLEAVEPIHWARVLIQLADHYLPDLHSEMTAIPSPPLIRQGVVFIAYAHEDRHLVEALAKALEAEGIAVWYDRKLHAGRRWCRELAKRIEASRALVAILSRQGRESEWVEREALYAIRHSVPLIPYLIEEIELPIWAQDYQAVRKVDKLVKALRSQRMALYTSASSCSDARDLLKALASAASAAGFRRVLCLVDEVDELPAVQGQSEKMVHLLARLMAPELRKVNGITFCYFLPADLELLLQGRRADFRLDRCHVEHLQWDKPDLKRLIRQRMIAFSLDRVVPRQSLGELCDPAGGFAGSLEDELVALAEGNPRAVVYLANQLLRCHCRVDNPPRLIRRETWEQVKVEWWLRGRAQIFGFPGEGRGFRLWGERIFFQQQEVALSPRYHALLCCLVQAGGKICSQADLARAGWPDDDPAGVTKRAVDEAMRRMKNKLREQGIDPGWIETVRGRGYRIRASLEGNPAKPEA